ncbi:chlorophyll a/b-binding protein, partial [Dunaliella salina]
AVQCRERQRIFLGDSPSIKQLRSRLVCCSSNEDGQDQSERSTEINSEKNKESPSLATGAAKLAAEIVASPLFYLVAGLIAIKLVSSTGEQSSSILVFAALPVTLLTALSKSPLGAKVQDDLQKRLPGLQAEAEALKKAQAEAQGRSPWYGSQRPLLPSFLRGEGGRHLKGEVAGDVGFDPLNLASEPETFAKYHEAELLHARWAMLGALGCLVPEVLAIRGVDVGEAVWWKVGKSKLENDLTLNWGGIEGFRIAGKQGIGIIAACQVFLMGGPEYARQVGIRSLEPVGVFLPGTQTYPGGAPFDPLGISKRPDDFAEQAVKEIKNGRLAMVAMAGYFAQAAVTRQGPVQNFLDFLKDPAANNLLAQISSR